MQGAQLQSSCTCSILRCGYGHICNFPATAHVCTVGLVGLPYLTIYCSCTHPELEDILRESCNYNRAACALGFRHFFQNSFRSERELLVHMSNCSCKGKQQRFQMALPVLPFQEEVCLIIIALLIWKKKPTVVRNSI